MITKINRRELQGILTMIMSSPDTYNTTKRFSKPVLDRYRTFYEDICKSKNLNELGKEQVAVLPSRLPNPVGGLKTILAISNLIIPLCMLWVLYALQADIGYIGIVLLYAPVSYASYYIYIGTFLRRQSDVIFNLSRLLKNEELFRK